MSGTLKLYGRFSWEKYSPDGILLDSGEIQNGITTAGLNDLLESGFRAGTQRTAYYVGLISLTGFTALSASDTMSSHSGWTESQNYGEAARVQWSPAAAAAGVLTNASAMSFTMNANETIKGLFLTTVSTKGGTTGILWSTGAFSANQQMSSGEVLKITYTLTASAGVEG